jgi:hypothetical protein
MVFSKKLGAFSARVELEWKTFAGQQQLLLD